MRAIRCLYSPVSKELIRPTPAPWFPALHATDVAEEMIGRSRQPPGPTGNGPAFPNAISTSGITSTLWCRGRLA